MTAEETEVKNRSVVIGQTDMYYASIEMAKAGDYVSLMTDTAEEMYSKAFLEKNRKLFPILAKFTKPKSRSEG